MSKEQRAVKRIVKSHGAIVVTLPPVKVPHWMEGFVEFVREQGVVGLAVGLILGVASKSVIDSVVVNVFNPVIGLITGGGSLASKAFCLNDSCSSRMGYGQVISDLLSFFIVAAIVYLLVKRLKLDKLDTKIEKPKDK